MHLTFRHPAVLLLALSIASVTSLSGCTKKRVLIYTSLGKDVIAEMNPVIKSAIPDVRVKWVQGGTEKLRELIDQERKEQKKTADIVIISDPYWYLKMKREGALLRYESPAAKDIPLRYADPDHAFMAVRLHAFVIGYNADAIKTNQLPQSWKDLLKPAWKGKVTFGNPHDSGLNFASVSVLSTYFGWNFFSSLKGLSPMSAGGSQSVLLRLLTKQYPLGVLMLESVLKTQAKGDPIKAIYPLDGVVIVPGPIAIMADAESPKAAKKVYDWFFSSAAQTAITHGFAYSPYERIEPPGNARSLSELAPQILEWSPELLMRIYETRDQIMGKFSEIMLH